MNLFRLILTKDGMEGRSWYLERRASQGVEEDCRCSSYCWKLYVFAGVVIFRTVCGLFNGLGALVDLAS